jgi:hypothetical protein
MPLGELLGGKLGASLGFGASWNVIFVCRCSVIYKKVMCSLWNHNKAICLCSHAQDYLSSIYLFAGAFLIMVTYPCLQWRIIRVIILNNNHHGCSWRTNVRTVFGSFRPAPILHQLNLYPCLAMVNSHSHLSRAICSNLFAAIIFFFSNYRTVTVPWEKRIRKQSFVHCSILSR